MTVLSTLRSQILERLEERAGYSFCFEGNDRLLDELNEFIKTERACCPFFTFTLVADGNSGATWLHLTGPIGVKKFIRYDLDFLAP